LDSIVPVCFLLLSNFRYSCLRQAGLQIVGYGRHDELFVGIDYLIFRSKVGFKTQIKNWQIDLYAGINNITDQHYASMLLINAVGFGGSQPRYYYPGAPRNYYGGFTLKYLIGEKVNEQVSCFLDRFSADGREVILCNSFTGGRH